MTRRQMRESNRNKSIIIAILILAIAIIGGKAIIDNKNYENRIAELKNEVSTLTDDLDELVDDTHALYEEVCEKYSNLDVCAL